ncbi:MAG: xanthine dehydrogenase family protein molybdopterin-binding subunit [Ardenticatenaceae bacterium]|nr:xanthine dehydrogenase family protein molybdopterin-binding subunit [Ardenticatenaceae bacterium]
MSKKAKMSRRSFMKLGAVGGTGLLLGVYFGFGGELVKEETAVWGDQAEGFTPNAWLRIAPDNSITVRINHSEMGQGVTTGLAMIVAEELEADWNKIAVEIAPAESVYKNPAFNSQFTGDSTSTRTSWDILRRAGAAAREMLITAAAMTWEVETAVCQAETSTIIHTPTGERLTYGQLAPIAATLPIPTDPPLKQPKDFKLIGQPIARLDTAVKSRGEAIFGIDVQLPDMLIATVIHPPTFDATLRNVEAADALAMPGVHEVLEIDGGVAVVADTFWQARQAAYRLQLEWSEPQNPVSSDQIRETWRQLAETEPGEPAFELGDAPTAMASAVQTIHAVYELPYQTHATPEPMNCTALVANGRCQVWAPTQHQDASQEIAAKLTGLAYEDVDIYTTYLGGGYGRRINVDYVAEAVAIAKEIERPVKVIWTRDEDMRHGFYRPAAYNVLDAGLDDAGKLVAWQHKIIGPDFMPQGIKRLIPSMLPYFLPRLARNVAGSVAGQVAGMGVPGDFAKEGAGPLPYPTLTNVQVNHVNDDPGVPIGFWRSVAFSKNTFVVESFIDEIAAATGEDPFVLRYRLADGDARLQHVLQFAAEKADWGRPSHDGIYQGMAAVNFQETRVCSVAEVSVSEEGHVTVHRMVMVVDCGTVVNPKLVTAQIEGGVAFGLTAALKSSITVKDSQVVQSNYHDFQLLRMNEMPEVEVHLVPSTLPPTGAGEAGVPTTAPAVLNAVFAATGKRIRSIPIDPNELKEQDAN